MTTAGFASPLHLLHTPNLSEFEPPMRLRQVGAVVLLVSYWSPMPAMADELDGTWFLVLVKRGGCRKKEGSD